MRFMLLEVVSHWAELAKFHDDKNWFSLSADSDQLNNVIMTEFGHNSSFFDKSVRVNIFILFRLFQAFKGVTVRAKWPFKTDGDILDVKIIVLDWPYS